MKSHSIFRILSIICYLLIFIPGWMMAFPFILVLTMGVADAKPTERLLLILADLALIVLAILCFKKKTKLRMALDCLMFPLLLSPLVWMLASFPLDSFDSPLFFVPFAGFAMLYPLSTILSFLQYKHRFDS
jgi:hypothetical protein